MTSTCLCTGSSMRARELSRHFCRGALSTTEPTDPFAFSLLVRRQAHLRRTTPSALIQAIAPFADIEQYKPAASGGKTSRPPPHGSMKSFLSPPKVLPPSLSLQKKTWTCWGRA